MTSYLIPWNAFMSFSSEVLNDSSVRHRFKVKVARIRTVS